jgi:CheY-like chemotaxis protein
VFVADDDESILRALKRAFEARGFTVHTASNYVGAVALLDANDYVLVVCDNGMPLGGERRPHPTCGLQLLAHAKFGRQKDTPFIIHTADDSDKTIADVALCGGIYQAKIYGGGIDAFLSHLKS